MEMMKKCDASYRFKKSAIEKVGQIFSHSLKTTIENKEFENSPFGPSVHKNILFQWWNNYEWWVDGRHAIWILFHEHRLHDTLSRYIILFPKNKKLKFRGGTT